VIRRVDDLRVFIETEGFKLVEDSADLLVEKHDHAVIDADAIADFFFSMRRIRIEMTPEPLACRVLRPVFLSPLRRHWEIGRVEAVEVFF